MSGGRFNDRCLGDFADFVSPDKWIGDRGWKLRHHGLLCGFEFVNGMELEPVWFFLDMRAAVDDSVDMI